MFNLKMSNLWLIQRISALLIVALLPAVSYSIVEWTKLEFNLLRYWFTLGRAFIFGIFMSSILMHSFLGIETVIEDYIPILWRKKALTCSKWIHIGLVALTWITLIILVVLGSKK
jgi:succinate dehydrogenase hydrophobic anchor subunit